MKQTSSEVRTQKSNLLQTILADWRHGDRGPLPQLTRPQLLAALVVIQQEGPIGRRALAQAIQIKDGVCRGLLERLSEKKMIMIGENGALLSDLGSQSLESELGLFGVEAIRSLGASNLIPGKSMVGVQIVDRYVKSISGVAERDQAVRVGADGAMTIAFLDGRLVLPPDNRAIPDDENSRLRDLFHLSERDLLIIGFAETHGQALLGALSATLSLAAK